MDLRISVREKWCHSTVVLIDRVGHQKFKFRSFSMLVQHQRQFFLNLLIFLVTSTSKSTIELLSLFLSFSHPRIAKVWRTFTPRAIPTFREQLDTAAKALRTTGTLEETVSNSFNNNHNKTLVCNNANHSGSHHNRNRNNNSIFNNKNKPRNPFGLQMSNKRRRKQLQDSWHKLRPGT